MTRDQAIEIIDSVANGSPLLKMATVSKIMDYSTTISQHRSVADLVRTGKLRAISRKGKKAIRILRSSLINYLVEEYDTIKPIKPENAEE